MIRRPFHSRLGAESWNCPRRNLSLPGSLLPARILLGMVAGAAVGLAFGPRVAGLGEIGKVVIGLIKMLATPLILFVVLDALLRSSLKAKSGFRIVVISMINGAFALAIAMTLANTLKPGRVLEPPTSRTAVIMPVARPLRIFEDMLGIIPPNLVDPFRNNAILPVVMLAVCVGIALRKFKSEQIESGATDYLAIEGFVSGGLRSCELVLGWVVALLPFAVFAVMAQAIGTQGLSILGGIAKYPVSSCWGWCFKSVSFTRAGLCFSHVCRSRLFGPS